jgi:hypothetical protein
MSLIPLIPYALLIVGTGAAFMGAFGLFQLWRDSRAKRLHSGGVWPPGKPALRDGEVAFRVL